VKLGSCRPAAMAGKNEGLSVNKRGRGKGNIETNIPRRHFHQERAYARLIDPFFSIGFLLKWGRGADSDGHHLRH